MFNVQVCAANMDGLFGPKFSKQASLFGRPSFNMGGFSRNFQNKRGKNKNMFSVAETRRY